MTCITRESRSHLKVRHNGEEDIACFCVVATILTIGINTAGCRLLPLPFVFVATSSTTIINSVVGVIVTFCFITLVMILMQ